MKLFKLWLDGILHWRVPKAVQTEQLIGFAVVGVGLALLMPSVTAWPLWAQCLAGAGVVLLVGLINGGVRALAER